MVEHQSLAATLKAAFETFWTHGISEEAPTSASRRLSPDRLTLPESPLLPRALDQPGRHRYAGSLPVDEVVHEHEEQRRPGRFEPQQRPVGRLELHPGAPLGPGASWRGPISAYQSDSVRPLPVAISRWFVTTISAVPS